jgi:hypothetical protein
VSDCLSFVPGWLAVLVFSHLLWVSLGISAKLRLKTITLYLPLLPYQSLIAIFSFILLCWNPLSSPRNKINPPVTPSEATPYHGHRSYILPFCGTSPPLMGYKIGLP